MPCEATFSARSLGRSRLKLSETACVMSRIVDVYGNTIMPNINIAMLLFVIINLVNVVSVMVVLTEAVMDIVGLDTVVLSNVNLDSVRFCRMLEMIFLDRLSGACQAE